MNKVIAIDFDGVCNDLTISWVAWLNHYHNVHKHAQDMVHWDMTMNFPELTAEEIYKPLSLAEFWDTVYVYPTAKEVIQDMKLKGFKVYLVTTTSYKHAAIKFDHCLFKYLKGVISSDEIILTSHKELIQCDYLIDDYEMNLKDSKAFRFLIDTTYNQNVNSEWYDIRSGSLGTAWKFIKVREGIY